MRRGHREFRAHKVLRELQVPRVFKGLRVTPVQLAPKVFKALREFREIQVQQVRTEQPEAQDLPVHRAHKGMQAQLAQPAV